METRRLAIKKANESKALESYNSELWEQVSRMYDYNKEVRGFCSELYGMLDDYACPKCPYECPGIDDPSTCKIEQRMSELDIETQERKRVYPFDCGMVTYDGENVECEFDE